MNDEMFQLVNDASTIEEMRAEIYRLERYEPLVRGASDLARYKGLSGEDKFTVIAYLALRERALLRRHVLEFEQTSVRPIVMSQET